MLTISMIINFRDMEEEMRLDISFREMKYVGVPHCLSVYAIHLLRTTEIEFWMFNYYHSTAD